MANETVLFKRGDSATITSTPVTDGQILFDTSGNGKMYLDNGTDRLEMGGAITVDASLSKTSTNAIQNKAVTGNILNSLAEVSAATQQNTIAGALALKEVNSSLGTLSFGQDDNGNWGYRIAGADPVIPFKSGIKLKKTCNQSQLTIDEDYDECLLVFASGGSYGSLAITNGGNYTMEEAGKSMTVNAGTVNGQANTGCFLIKNLPKGAIISATKSNSAATIWNYSFWLFA